MYANIVIVRRSTLAK